MHEIAFLDRATLAPQIVLREPRFDHQLIEYENTAPEQVLQRLAGVSVAIINKVALTQDVLAQLHTRNMLAMPEFRAMKRKPLIIKRDNIENFVNGAPTHLVQGAY